MLKWLVQRIPDPAGGAGGGGDGRDPTHPTEGVKTTDDPLATINIDGSRPTMAAVATSGWSFGNNFPSGTGGSRSQKNLEIYSVRRTNPLYVEDNDVEKQELDENADADSLEAKLNFSSTTGSSCDGVDHDDEHCDKSSADTGKNKLAIQKFW